MAWQQKRAHAGSTGVNVVFTQTVVHSPGVYTAQPWNDSCSDTSRLEAIAQVHHPDVLLLPLWRHTWTPRPWCVTSTSCGLKTSPKRTNGVSVYTKPESNITLGCTSVPFLWLDDEHQSPNVACCLRAQTMITSKKICFSGTSKHS